MPEIRNPLRTARAAAIVGLWLSASLLGASVGRAQQCEVQIDRSPGGVIEGRTSAGLVFDPELEIEVAPDLSTVRLENSILRVVYTTLPEPPEYSITDFVIKEADEDQLGDSFGFMDAGAGLGPLESATMIADRPDRKTVRLVWCSESVPDGIVNCSKKIIKEVTIYPHQPYIQLDNIDIQWQGNYADLGEPGGVLTGVHVVHGSEDWIRPFSYHDDDPTISKGAYYTRYVGDGILDPPDGGSLSYNGHFVVAVFNPSNGRGWGRVARVEDTEIIKLLMTAARSQGIEFFHYPFLIPHSQPFTSYIYAVRDGYNDALPTGRYIADLGSAQPQIACGNTLDLAAIPYTNWQRDGWTGSLAGVPDAHASVTLAADVTVGADFSQSAADYEEDFDALSPGDDPVDWLDTGANNSLIEDGTLFEVGDLGGERAFRTVSGANNVHSHYTGTATSSPDGYEFSGRMRMTEPGSGLGVTVFSGFPNDTNYYRLRRYSPGSFHLTANGTTIIGDPDTGVVPVEDAWYQFRIQAENATDRTWVRAKVWKDGFPEPPAWQVEVYDDSLTRLQGGAAGIWTSSLGVKFVDDLAIRQLPAPRSDLVLSVNTVGSGNVVVTPSQAQYATGDVVTLEAVGSSGEVFDRWGGALAGFQNPRQLTLVDDATVTAFFEAPTPRTLTKIVNGQGAITASPDLPQYRAGDVVELTATPDPNWFFTGWSGDLTTTNASSFLRIDGDVTVTANFAEAALMEDFEGYSAGADPTDWWDTGAGNSLTQNDSLFSVQGVGGTQALSTTSTQVNIHSHYLGPELQSLGDYRFTGRMRFDNATGGLGVTFFSQFPSAADYYRLRVVPDQTITLTPSGGRSVTGVTDTGITPVAGSWYRFAIEVEDTGSRTDMRAKVWLDGDPEPVDWQVAAYDDAADHLRSGTIGVWSMTAGNKYWDAFDVAPLPPPPPIHTLDTPVVGSGTVTKTPDAPLYAMGDVVSLEATPAPGYVFTGWSGGVTSTSNPLDVSVLADTSVTATFEEIQFFSLTLSTTGDGGGSIAAIPYQSTYVLGQTVTLTAVPGPNAYFGGWSGDAGGQANPIDLVITGPTSVSADFGVGFYAHDFEAQSIGDNPVDWFDTGANNSLDQADYLFNIQSVGTGQAFTTTSPAINIHSHYVGPGASTLTGYRYSGRMQMTSGDSGIGVTFLSRYPTQGAYYRLRRYAGTGFHLSPVGTSITSGSVDTGVVPAPGLWYRFVVEVEDTGSETRIRAKVWEEQSAEPTGFQIDALDDSPSRLTSGTFGVWANASGTKHWDDLAVADLGPGPALPVPAIGAPGLALLLSGLLGAAAGLALQRGRAARDT